MCHPLAELNSWVLTGWLNGLLKGLVQEMISHQKVLIICPAAANNCEGGCTFSKFQKELIRLGSLTFNLHSHYPRIFYLHPLWSPPLPALVGNKRCIGCRGCVCVCVCVCAHVVSMHLLKSTHCTLHRLGCTNPTVWLCKSSSNFFKNQMIIERRKEATLAKHKNN